MTDIQVLQQLLDRELNGGSLISSVAVDKRNVTPVKSMVEIVVPPQPSLPLEQQLQPSAKPSFITSEIVQEPSSKLIESTSLLPSTISYLQSSQTMDTKSHNSDIIEDSSSVLSEQTSLNSFSTSLFVDRSKSIIKPSTSMSLSSQNKKHIIIQSLFPENLKTNSHEFVTLSTHSKISSSISFQFSSSQDVTTSIRHHPTIMNTPNLENPKSSEVRSFVDFISTDATEKPNDTEVLEHISSTKINAMTTIKNYVSTTFIGQPSNVKRFETISQMDFTALSSQDNVVIEQSSVIRPSREVISSSRHSDFTSVINPPEKVIISSRRHSDVISSRNSEEIIIKTSQFIGSSNFEESTQILFKDKSSDVDLNIKSESIYKEIETTFIKEIHSTRNVVLSRHTQESSSKIELETIPNSEIYPTTSINIKASVNTQNVPTEISSTSKERNEQITLHSVLSRIISSSQAESRSNEQLQRSTPIESSPILTIQTTPQGSMFIPSKMGVGVRTKQIEDEIAYSSITRPPSLRSKSQFSFEEKPPQPPEDKSSKQIVQDTTALYKQFRKLSTMSEINFHTTPVSYNEFPDHSTISVSVESTITPHKEFVESSPTPLFETDPNSNAIIDDISTFKVFPSTKIFPRDSYLQQTNVDKKTFVKSTYNNTWDSSIIVPTPSLPIMLTSTIQPIIPTSSKIPESSKSKVVTSIRKCKTCKK